MSEMPDQVFIDKDYPQTKDNRFSLKQKERQGYTRNDLCARPVYSSDIEELLRELVRAIDARIKGASPRQVSNIISPRMQAALDNARELLSVPCTRCDGDGVEWLPGRSAHPSNRINCGDCNGTGRKI